VDAQQSSDLRTWDSAIRLIGGAGYNAYITITPGEKKWILLMVYDPAASLGGGEQINLPGSPEPGRLKRKEWASAATADPSDFLLKAPSVSL
jgi:hypothetical protein